MNTLIIVAHPDDEVLGAGATIRKLASQGQRVAVYTLSPHCVTREPDLLEKQQRGGQLTLGIAAYYSSDIETMKFHICDRYKEVQKIEKVIEKERPDTIITHFPGDLHNDHKITTGLVHEAIRLPQRQLGYGGPTPRLLYMEVPTSTDWSLAAPFSPNHFEEITFDDITAKSEALSMYDYVLRKPPHPRNLDTFKAAARYRGAQAGVLYAEAFMVALEVNVL